MPKFMFGIFFRTTAVVHIDCANKGQTIDNLYYIENFLKPVVKTLERDRPKCGAKSLNILIENARTDVHENVNNFLKEHSIGIDRHSSYSPDFVPCDFWIFSFIKSHLDTYSDVQSLKRQIHHEDRGIKKIDRKVF